MPSRIEDYALIGDCQTAALVGPRRLDRLALPAALRLGRLLRRPAGRPRARPLAAGPGRRRPRRPPPVPRRHARPGDRVRDRRRGRRRHRLHAGRAARGPDLVRLVEGRRGRVPMRMELVIRFDYGSIVPWVQQTDGRHLADRRAGLAAAARRRPAARRGPHHRGRVRRRGRAGACRSSLAWHPSHEPAPPAGRRRRRRSRDTEAWWRDVVGPLHLPGRVARGRRPLAHHAQGADLRADRRHRRRRRPPRCPSSSAACATGTTASAGSATPRSPCFALLNAGYRDEARAWRDWLLRAVAGRPAATQHHVRPGRRAAADRAGAGLAARLRGVAAGAHRQRGLPRSSSSTSTARCSTRCTSRASSAWRPRRPAGGWSRRCWTSSARRAAGRTRGSGRCAGRGGTSPTRRSWPGWRWTGRSRRSRTSAWTGRSTSGGGSATEIHAQVCREGFDAGLGSFVQSYGAKELDASLLMIPLVGFLPADDPRVRGHGGGDRAAPDARRVRATATRPSRRSTACRRARGRSWPARSGWPTT